jgi:hypothetical protein
MELDCYLHPGWQPRIRAATMRRAWMDATPDSFAYRCLPMNIANANGWEILSPCGFEAVWTGGNDASAVRITLDPGALPHEAPVSLFGQGTITFHVSGLFRTPPGWNLWVGGPPNEARDGIAPLNGVIETDWSPYTFTMNWRFTRPDHPIRFEENEPFCFFFPIERSVIEAIEPRFRPLDEAPELKHQFEAWSRSRDAFHARMAADPPPRPADHWQKLYYRGLDAEGASPIADHQSKLRPREFTDPPTEIAERRCPVAHAPADGQAVALRRRDWLHETRQRIRMLSERASGVPIATEVSPQEFLDLCYAPGRPVLLRGIAADWPALHRWRPEYLRAMVGAAAVEVQGGRSANPAYERDKQAHRRTMAFDAFLDAIDAAQDGNDVYLTAYNQGANAAALAPLRPDIGEVEGLLRPGSAATEGMLWIGPAGTFTPLHHDLTNNLLIQIVGRKDLVLVAPEETAKLYNDHHVYSAIGDVEAVDLARFPLAADARGQKIRLEPGDALFLPIGWWHQVRALDFSVSLTATSFPWPNDFHSDFPDR